MAILGAILLKGLHKKSKRHSFKLDGKPKPTAHSLENKKKSPQVVDRKSTALAPIAQRPNPAADAFALQTSSLIRPNDLLKHSIESFLLDQRSIHTRRAYGKDLNRFVKFLIERKLRLGVQSIDRALLISYKDQLLSENLQHTTIDRHLATLRSFFRWLVEDGIIVKNPAENIRFLNPKRESPTIGFTDEEVIRILAMPNLYTKTGSLHYAVLMVLFYCGLRRSELCDLRTSQVGLERGHRFLRLKGKGNAERIVVMRDAVWNALQHYLKICRKDLTVDQPLFSPIRNNRTLKQNKPLDSSMIFYIVTRYAKLAGMTSKVSPHSCRATAISNARDHQVPDRAIQEFAGWSTTTMITRYDKRKSSLEKSAVHAIDYGKDEREMPFITPKNVQEFSKK